MSAAAAPGRSVGRGSKSDILHHPITRSALPFLNGGAAGMIATSFIQPVDMVKVCFLAPCGGLLVSGRVEFFMSFSALAQFSPCSGITLTLR